MAQFNSPKGDIFGGCCDDGVIGGEFAGATVSVNTVSATGAGSTTAGVMKVSVVNTGIAAGTWDGVSLPPLSFPLVYEGYPDWETGEFKRLNSISYDATGTTFIITEIP